MERSTLNFAVILDTRHSNSARLKPVSINNVQMDNGFWNSRIHINSEVTLQTQYELLKATGRLDNFSRITDMQGKPYQGYVFNDSDVYKWLEAASWAMASDRSEELVSLVDEVIKLIASAQDKDGYLNSYFWFEKAGDRWVDLQNKHELYCAGHLIQAAIAHNRVTGDDKLLNVALRLADHIYLIFGPYRREGTCGHPEIEMALIELYRTTKNKKYLELAEIFINRRGYGLLGGLEYFIDHMPFRNLHQLAGHAVRALYLCAGATDLYIETGELKIVETLERLWSNLVNQKMYVTGGVGARHDGEALGDPYELPNARAYAETCAAIANLMWNWRMLQIDGNSRYADLMEWILYNAVLPGISLDGTRYFYVNPLQSGGDHLRKAWFECACCPPNISRTIAMLPGLIYSFSIEGVWINLYSGSTININILNDQPLGLHQITSYPWEGRVTIEFTAAQLNTLEITSVKFVNPFSLFLRIPSWLSNQNTRITINSMPIVARANPNGYLEIHRNWKIGDLIEIDFPMEVNYLEAHPLVTENSGRVVLSRGPLIYCVERVDNPDVSLSRIVVDPSIQPELTYGHELLNGLVVLNFKSKICLIDPDWDKKLYRPKYPISREISKETFIVKSIPYFAWANRAPGEMQMWHLYQ